MRVPAAIAVESARGPRSAEARMPVRADVVNGPNR